MRRGQFDSVCPFFLNPESNAFTLVLSALSVDLADTGACGLLIWSGRGRVEMEGGGGGGGEVR